jgi:hypothetical protein
MPRVRQGGLSQAAVTHPQAYLESGPSTSATASWTAVAEMHGASLHRRHRFRRTLAHPSNPAHSPARSSQAGRAVGPPTAAQRSRNTQSHRQTQRRSVVPALAGIRKKPPLPSTTISHHIPPSLSQIINHKSPPPTSHPPSPPPKTHYPPASPSAAASTS